jgi:hypothetical protein
VRYSFKFDNVDIYFNARVDWVSEMPGTGSSGPGHGGALVPHFQSEVPQTSIGKSRLRSDLKQAIQLTDSMISEGINAAGNGQAQFWRTLGWRVLDAYNSRKAGTGDRFAPGTGTAHWRKPNKPKYSPEYVAWENARRSWNRRWEDAKGTLTVTLL